MLVCCECCVLWGRVLCDELITCPEVSYRVWCVVCGLESSWMRRACWPQNKHQTKMHFRAVIVQPLGTRCLLRPNIRRALELFLWSLCVCVCVFVCGLSEVRFKVKEVFVCCSVASIVRDTGGLVWSTDQIAVENECVTSAVRDQGDWIDWNGRVWGWGLGSESRQDFVNSVMKQGERFLDLLAVWLLKRDSSAWCLMELSC
jgi:hypothetical protein